MATDGEITDRAKAAQTVGDLARVLRDLRRREARDRAGPELTYQEMADRTGWSVAAIGGYFTGTKTASTERFDALIRLLGATPSEQGVLATARDRVGDLRSATSPDEVPAAAPDGPAPDAPHMLPPRVFGFTGRRHQLTSLDGQLARSVDAGTVVISAVAGMGGVGKTALAVHWAHGVAEHFPDGELYVNLRGFDPGEPLTVSAALGTLVGALGVEPSAMPSDVDARLALYRRMLADRRMLVLLDNASGAEQVRPLLPPAPCLALVTSRDALTELVTKDGARRIAVDVLPAEDAIALLRLLIGERAEQEPDAVQAIAELCANLPLALRVAAEHVASRPVLTLTDLVEEFRAETSHAGLDAFDTTGDVRTDVRSVFSWSLRRLAAPVARAFRLLGLVPGGDVDAYALAALAGTDPAEAEAMAFVLAGAHLVEVSADGRFSMHDLLRAYAAESCAREIGADDRSAALTRLLDFYLAGATRAVDTRFVFNTPLVGNAAPAPTFSGAVPAVGDIPAAAAWLAAERSNMVRACVHAARHGLPRHAVALALTLRPFLDDGHDQDGLTVHNEALAAAETIGDAVSAARLRTALAITHSRVGLIDAAADYAQHAYDEQLRHGDLVGAVVSLAVLSTARMGQERYREAVDCQERALQLARRMGNRTMEANQLYNLASDYMLLEDFEAAAEHYRLAAVAYGSDPDDGGQPAHDSARGGLATALAGLGRLEEAMVLAEEATAIEFANGSTLDGLSAMTTLGSVYRRLGRLSDALEVLDYAADICAPLDNPTMTALVLNALGETHHDLGDQARAAICHRQARELADRVGDPFETARSLMGLGDAHAANGETEQARACWQAALDTYARLGMPSAARARERLSTLD